MASTPPGAARGRVVGDGSAGPYSGISVLIGAHVSPAGGPANAVARGVERGCRSIQIFNQNPRAWKPRDYTDEEVAAFHEAMDDSDVDALLIHAVYLLNCASEDPEIREKSLASLTASLRAGAALGALAVVLHPGSALKDGGAVPPALERAAAGHHRGARGVGDLPAAPRGHRRRRRHAGALVRGAGAAARARRRRRAARGVPGLLPPAGLRLRRPHRGRRSPACSTSSTRRSASTASARCTSTTPRTPLGSNRDRHASLGDGEIGVEGCAAFLSEPRFEGLPCVLEGPGVDGKGVVAADIRLAADLREQGLAARTE